MVTPTIRSDKPARTLPTAAELRESLLRPFPRLTPSGILLTLLIIAIFAWSWSASRPTAINRVKDVWDVFRAMGDLIARMLPPEFELARGTARTYNLFGSEFTVGWPLIINAVIETIQIAIMGTLAAVVMSLPLSLLAAKNTSPHPIIYQGVRFVLNFLRSIPELVFALLFVAAVGLGPFTGVVALAFGSVGSIARIYAEAIEQIDPQQVLALRATGAGGLQTFAYAVLPQAFPLLITYSVVYFESNVRHATILGYVGAGGVGYKLFEYVGTSDYQKLLGTAIVLVVAVTIIDRLSSQIRQRFI